MLVYGYKGRWACRPARKSSELTVHSALYIPSAAEKAIVIINYFVSLWLSLIANPYCGCVRRQGPIDPGSAVARWRDVGIVAGSRGYPGRSTLLVGMRLVA